jgi:hypothetical protein
VHNTAVDFYQPETKITFTKEISFHPSLTFGERMFLAEIHALSQKNTNKRCPFSSRRLSSLFGVSHQAILNWIKKLLELELIEVGVDYNNPTCRQFLKTKLGE